MSTQNRSDRQLKTGDALLIVDVQNDFLPGGTLEVPRGDEVVPVLNRYQRAFAMHNLPVYVTRDWHPALHCSFRSQGGILPAHCVAGTRGADFSETLQLPASAVIISKAVTPDKDAYSGFQETDLDHRLREDHIHRLFIGGLATDYCMLNTARDALRLGYRVFLLMDAIRASGAKPGSSLEEGDEILNLGAEIITVEKICA